MNKKTTTIALATFAAITGFGLSQAFAQGNELRLAGAFVADKSAYTNLPNFIKFGIGQEVKPENLVNWAVYAFNVQNNSTFKPYETFNDELGYTHTRYRQYVDNYPVEGSQIISHAKDGVVKMVNGDYYQNFSSNMTAWITEQGALQYALQKVNAQKYMWEDDFMVKVHEQNYLPKGELVVVHKRGADFGAGNMRLAYKFNIYASVPLSRAYIYVDANTGEILDKQNLIHTADVVGTAVTMFSGTVTTTCDNTSGPYRLHESGRGNGIVTKNLNNGTSYGSATDITNSSATWNLAGNAKASNDAHWGAEMTYDYYKTIHGRNSIDGSGYALNSYMHYSTNFVNAFWDGSEMTYGDGDVSQGFLIMTALDVCGHEITHGLTSFTSGLNGGGSGEPDALNEGNSDIFGTTIEAYARPTQWDWIMGADITCNTSGAQDHLGIRDMSNPKNPNYTYPQPNCYNGQYWDAAGEPHNNDGPFIYWYYLLCQGGTGTNDIGNAWNVTGITMAKAKMIAFRQNTVYFTSSTTYANARTFSIQAATDLYGICSQELTSTTNSWYAIGVGAASAGGGVPTAAFTANNTISCTAPLAVTFSNGTIGATSYNWSFGDGGTSTAATPAHTYTAAGVYAVQLIATGTCSASAKDTLKKTSYITVNGAPTAVSPTPPACGPQSYSLTANGIGTVTWSNSSGVVGTGSNYTTPTLTATTTYSVTSSIIVPGTATLSGAPTTTATLGTGGYLAISNGHYLVFDALAGFTLKSVDIDVQSATLTAPIQLEDNTGTVLYTITPTLTATGKNTVTLNWHIPTGTGYKLMASSSGTNSLYRNNAGATYPIAVGSVASITGNDVMSTAPAYYYWFYNWVYAADVSCASPATIVTAAINSCSGINNVSAGSLEIYPNPAHDNLIISAQQNVSAIRVIDMLGKTVITRDTENEKFITLDVSSLPPGVYFVKVNAGNAQKLIKVIKQ
jgi:Zn-dependent metalloprotease